MSQQPDKLFRDKLYHYEKPVSGGAWERISSTRNGGTSFGILYKVAATVTLLAVAGFLIFRSSADQQPAMLAVKADPSAATPPAPSALPATGPTTSSSPVEKQPASIQADVAMTRRKASKAVIDSKGVTPHDADVTGNAGFAKSESATAKPVASDTMLTSSHYVATTDAKTIKSELFEQTAAQNATPRKTITIVLSAEMVNEKYLTLNENSEATTAGKEASTLRKLLDIAYDLKHNQDPIGDLRQKKDEILAFNFKRGKNAMKTN